MCGGAFVDANLGAYYSSVKLYTFGLGPTHDRHMLFTLSNDSCPQCGCYYNLADASEIGPSFAEVLTSLQSVVAQDATLAIEVGKDATLVGCHTRYPVREFDDDGELVGSKTWSRAAGQSGSSGGFVPGGMVEMRPARGATVSLGHLVSAGGGRSGMPTSH